MNVHRFQMVRYLPAEKVVEVKSQRNIMKFSFEMYRRLRPNIAEILAQEHGRWVAVGMAT